MATREFHFTIDHDRAQATLTVGDIKATAIYSSQGFRLFIHAIAIHLMEPSAEKPPRPTLVIMDDPFEDTE